MKKTLFIIMLLSFSSLSYALITDTSVTSVTGNFTGIIYENGTALSSRYAPILATYNNITGLNSTKAQIGSSAACTYGVANLTLNAQGVPTVTCSAQQGANNLIDVTSANTYIAVSGTTNKTLTFNASTLVTTYYNATAVAVVTGTPQGSVVGLQVYDNIPYNVSEVLSDVDFNVTFTGVTNFNQVIIRYKSVAGENHEMSVYLWDYVTSSWEGYQLLGHTNGVYNIISIGVFDPSDHASAINAPRIRFETTNIGASTDKWNFDLVQIAQGQGTPSSIETDPFSIHKDGTTPLTANWNAGAFNITAQDVLVDELKVSGGFGSTGITINNGDYWGDGNLYILGNLTAVTLTSQIFNASNLPSINNTWTLGNSSNLWLAAYATTYYENNVALNLKYAPILATYNNITTMNTTLQSKGSSNLTLTQIQANIGNWSGNQSSYSTTSAASLLYAPILATYNNITTMNTTLQSKGSSNLTLTQIQANIGNWSADKDSYASKIYANITGSGTANAITIWSNGTNVNTGTTTVTIGQAINMTATGTVVHYAANNCYQVSNSTGVYFIC
jgi:hypothetical protein